jgi:hypothetical protein
MIYIFDDTFKQEEIEAVQKWAVSLPRDDTWFEMSELLFAQQLFDLAGKYFDLSNTVGCEMHINYETPDPHKDKDEEAWFSNKQMIHPLCSIVYYPKIEISQGGKLFFPDAGVVVTPKTNRTVIFRSDLLHSGTPCVGVRQSIGLNPWDRVPLTYQTRE